MGHSDSFTSNDGGYRRKADVLLLGRNSRIRSRYVQDDVRGSTNTVARIVINNNQSENGRTTADTVIKSCRFDKHYWYGDGVAPLSSRDADIRIYELSGLGGAVYKISCEFEVDDNGSIHSETFSVTNSIVYQTILSIIDNIGYMQFSGTEFFIDPAYKNAPFYARRFRLHFYNKDSGADVLEYTTGYTDWYTFSPVVGISNIDASVLYGVYDTDDATIFDYASNSTVAKLYARFENITYTGDAETYVFGLRFGAESTQVYNAPVLFEEVAPFDLTGGTNTTLDLKLIQPPNPINESYAVTGLSVRIIPGTWSSKIPKTLGYGWDPSWDNPVTISPTTIRTFTLTGSVINITPGTNTAIPYKTVHINLETLTALDADHMGLTIRTKCSFITQRSGQTSIYSTTVLPNTYKDITPSDATPYLLHDDSVRGTTDVDLKSPCQLAVSCDFTYPRIGGEIVHTNTLTFTPVPPHLNTMGATLQNQTSLGYDIQLSSFDGFTEFNTNGASGERAEYIFVIKIVEVGTETVLHTYPDFTFDLTVPQTLKTVSRAEGSPDLSWFPETYVGTHRVDITVKYNYDFYPYPGEFTVATLTNLATSSAFVSLYPKLLWSLADEETLPFTTATNKNYSVTDSELPQDDFDWKIEMWMTGLATNGVSYKSMVLFGPDDAADVWGDDVGFRLAKEGDTPYIFWKGSGNLRNFGANKLAGLVQNDQLKWTLTYTASTREISLQILKNDVAITGLNGPFILPVDWILYPVTKYIGLHLNPSDTQWDKVEVWKLNP